MAVTKDFGRFFFHLAKLPRQARLLGVAPTQEIDPPFRRSDSIVVRFFPLNIGLVVGVWQDTDMDEEEALLTAIDGTKVSLVEEEDDAVDHEQDRLHEKRQAILREIGRQHPDLDEEWEIINMIGVPELLEVDVDDAAARVKASRAQPNEA